MLICKVHLYGGPQVSRQKYESHGITTNSSRHNRQSHGATDKVTAQSTKSRHNRESRHNRQSHGTTDKVTAQPRNEAAAEVKVHGGSICSAWSQTINICTYPIIC